MRVFRLILIVLLAALVAGQWVMVVHQRRTRPVHRAPSPGLVRLLEQAQLNEHRLAAVAAQNEVLTTRTLAILERLAVAPAATAPALSHSPDAPVVLYEAEPVKPAVKGRRQ
jgi:hypothetical protein